MKLTFFSKFQIFFIKVCKHKLQVAPVGAQTPSSPMQLRGAQTLSVRYSLNRGRASLYGSADCCTALLTAGGLGCAGDRLHRVMSDTATPLAKLAHWLNWHTGTPG